MTPTLLEWQRKHGITAEALADLADIVGLTVEAGNTDDSEKSVQDEARLLISKKGGRAFRNNKGVLPDPKTGRWIRFGLCNDTPKMGERLRSSDLIACVPVLITQEMVGTVIGQFTAIEVKKRGWHYTGTEHEQGQLAFGTLIIGLGGKFCFYNGEGEL